MPSPSPNPFLATASLRPEGEEKNAAENMAIAVQPSRDGTWKISILKKDYPHLNPLPEGEEKGEQNGV
jgi:hypothetical protein